MTRRYMADMRNALGTMLIDGQNYLYSGRNGHIRLAHEIGYALNDFKPNEQEEILTGSYSCIYVRACFLNPILDAKEWISEMRKGANNDTRATS